MFNNSFWDRIKHRNDVLLHTGFDYRGKVFRKSLSNVFFLDAKREALLLSFDDVIVWMIDYIKMIKKTFNWTLPKFYRDFN